MLKKTQMLLNTCIAWNVDSHEKLYGSNKMLNSLLKIFFMKHTNTGFTVILNQSVA